VQAQNSALASPKFCPPDKISVKVKTLNAGFILDLPCSLIAGLDVSFAGTVFSSPPPKGDSGARKNLSVPAIFYTGQKAIP